MTSDLAETLDASCRRVTTNPNAEAVVWRLWGEGPALVLVHGGHGSWTHWLHNIDSLSRHYTVIVPDLPGFGESGDLPAPQTLDAVARSISDGLDIVLDPALPFDMAGFSFGSTVGAHIAKLQARRLGRFVLVGPGGGLGGRLTPRPPLQKWRQLTDRAERDAAHHHNLEAFMIADPARIDAEAVNVQAHNAERARLNSRGMTRGAGVAHVLRDASLRLGAIWGWADLDGAEMLEERKDLLRAADPECRFAVLDGAHWVQYEAGEAFNQVLLRMLAPQWAESPAVPVDAAMAR